MKFFSLKAISNSYFISECCHLIAILYRIFDMQENVSFSVSDLDDLLLTDLFSIATAAEIQFPVSLRTVSLIFKGNIK